MLPRAALQRAIRPSLHLCNALRASPVRIQAYASKRPSQPPPPPSSNRPARPAPPPPKDFKPATGQVRQTSPGTALPKDQSWKPKDGVKFAGKASAPSGAAAAAASPVQGARTVDPASATQAPLSGDQFASRAQEEMVAKMRSEGKSYEEIAVELQKMLTPEQQQAVQKLQQMRAEGKSFEELKAHLMKEHASQEPMAQKTNADQPAAETVRGRVQDQADKVENQPAPSEPSETPSQTGPLPDLRHGIPSTFDFEFGQAKGRAAREDSQEDKLDLTNAEEGRGKRDDGEREYDRSAYETSLDRRRARLMNYMYATMVLGIFLTGFYLSRPFTQSDELPSGLEPNSADGWSPNKMWARVRARFGSQTGYYTEPAFPKLLPDVPESQRPPYTLVLSLEDLLIHTTWDTKHGYRTAKRPGVDYFIRYLSQYYELVLFTSAPRNMADPIMAKLDPYHFIMWPLGREATKYEKGEYIKDLSYLNRDLKKTIMVDTHAAHAKNQPENAVVIPKWSGDPKDTRTKDLVALIPFLEYVATMGIDDVRTVLKSFEGQSIPEEFARREAIAREKFNAQLAEEKKRKPKFSLGSLAGSLGVKGGGMGGGMVLADGQSVSEGLAQGKMLSDQIREQGQKQYEALEKQIRENGEQWLKEEAEEMKKMTEAQMKDMKQGALSWFGGGGKKE